MNKHTFFLFLAIIITSCSNAQRNSDIPLPPASPSISPRSFKAWITDIREVSGVITVWPYTENFVIFWEKGFGNDLSNPPQLEGHSMKVDLPGLKEKLENFYAYFYHTLQLPGKVRNVINTA